MSEDIRGVHGSRVHHQPLGEGPMPPDAAQRRAPPTPVGRHELEALREELAEEQRAYARTLEELRASKDETAQAVRATVAELLATREELAAALSQIAALRDDLQDAKREIACLGERLARVETKP